MLASAEAFTLPPVMEPPMMMTSFTRGTMEGSFSIGECNVGERADGDQRDFVRRSVDELDDEVGTEAGVDLALAGRKLDVGQAVLAVPQLSRDQLLKQRVLCSRGDGDIAAVCERHHPQRILQAHFGGDVARHNGDGADIEFGRSERQHQGKRVIGPGVGVEDDFLGRDAGRASAVSKQEMATMRPNLCLRQIVLTTEAKWHFHG